MAEGSEDQKTLEPVYCDKCQWHLFDIEIQGGERVIPKDVPGEITNDGFFTSECPNCGEVMKILPPSSEEAIKQRTHRGTETGFGAPEEDEDF